MWGGHLARPCFTLFRSTYLKAFRQAAYQHLTRAKDATFELTDAILLTRHAYCGSSELRVINIFWSELMLHHLNK
ncbi:hypothetical protein ACE1CI_36210 [Aerosakkonemataceae cyanobacterium BLCC-F50]|uniref:Uncharacterized protein n=1 Tax=Floridaenema flaviceps BLCC-F50 TaxID=3153642 RepID=A0ABV4Y334_9CYAN